MSRGLILQAYGERTVSELEFIVRTLDELVLVVSRGKDALIADVLLQRAVEGCASRIGNTIRNKIPAPLQEQYLGRAYWSAWIGWRVKLAHQYHSIDVNLLWQDLQRDVPEFRRLLVEEVLGP